MTDQSDTQRGHADPEAYCPACGKSYPPEIERCPTDGAILVRLAAKTDPLLGRVFEKRYEIRSQLGEGGMGAVYRGWQLSVDREVAIKVIDPKLSRNRDVVKRFLREARLSSRLSQSSIVNVYDFGQTEDGILYIVMELLRGHTLATELAAHRVFGVERTITIGVQLCDALDAAHKLGIVHRDLKPGNVVILDDPPGRDLVKVLDFGLAKSLINDMMSKVTQSDAMLGTPLYMSPEQIEGQPSDQRADLYSLGCMLHEMLSGTSPFAGKTVDRTLSNHMYELAAPLPPDVPPPLAELIVQLISKHPGDRPSSAADVRKILMAPSALGARLAHVAPPTVPLARGAPRMVQLAHVHAKTMPSSHTSAPPRSRRWIFVVAIAAVAIAVATVLLLQRGRTLTPAAPAPATSVGGATIATDAGVIDAPVPPVDAQRVRSDAGRVSRPPVRHVRDAGDDDIEFYHRDAR